MYSDQVEASEDVQLSRARWSIFALFLVHGLVVSTWVSRIPAVQSALRLSPADLGSVLLASVIGSMMAMPLTGALVHRFGSRKVVVITSLLFCASLLPLGYASSVVLLAGALWFYGASAGAMDVSMNVEAAALEKRYGRPIMSSFHGLFSVGGMAGAALGGAVAAKGVVVLQHFLWGAVLFAVLSTVFFPWLPPGSAEASEGFSFRFTRRLLALGLLAFCVLIGEGAMADWTAVYLRSVLETGPGTAAMGYAVFSAAMAAGRFAGDSLTERLGRVRLVRYGALLAAAGIGVAVFWEAVPIALAGFACVGAGFSTIVPIAFGAGANVRGVAPSAGVAAVTTSGYFGFLFGPPAIGFTAEYTSLRIGLGLVAMLSLVAASLAPFAEDER